MDKHYIDTGHKQITFSEDGYTYITFSTSDELQSFACGLTCEDYKSYYAYKLSCLKELHEKNVYDLTILHYDDEKHIIKYKMPTYKKSLYDIFQLLSNQNQNQDEQNNYWYNIISSQLPILISELLKHDLEHEDIAFRNIMVDENNNLHFIDLDSITKFNKKIEDVKLPFCYISRDFEKYNIDKKILVELKKLYANHIISKIT